MDNNSNLLLLVNLLANRNEIKKKVINFYTGFWRRNRMSNPKITVIIPFCNRIGWTIESVNSVLNQTFQDFELLLVDDGTSDDISPLLAIKDPRIRIIHQKNQGPAAARNNGMKHATGDYIVFLDSDDKFHPNKLATQLDLHEKNPNCWFSHTSYQYFNPRGGMLEVIHSGKFSGHQYPKILSDCPIACSTVMLKRAVIDKRILFEENYRISEDIIFFSKIAQCSEIIGIDIPYTLFRLTESTHAYSARAQIIGSQNILRYIHNKNPISSPKEKRIVLSEIYSYISQNYFILKKPIPAIFYFLLFIVFSSNKRERINNIFQRLCDRHFFPLVYKFRPPLIQRTKSFILRNAIRIKNAIKRRLSGT